MTRRAYLLGHGISHSLSPVMHNAAARAGGLPWRYELMDVEPDALQRAIARLRDPACSGANVTMPYKAAAVELADGRSPEVRCAGAANVLVHDDGRLVAHNTDVAGLRHWASRRAQEIAEGDAVVLGAGGAAAASLVALAESPPAAVVVAARRLDRARALAQAAAAWLPVPVRATELTRGCIGDARLIVNATALGMRADDPLPFDARELRAGQLVYDYVYRRDGATPLVLESLARGAAVCDGVAHLLAQAEPTFELLARVSAPDGAFAQALEAALGRAPRTWDDRAA